MIDILNAPFSEIEVQEAIFQMYPTKAPGPDGFSAIFYKKSWPLLKEKVTQSVLRMLSIRKLEEGLNRTLITLIPKCRNPKKVEDYRPISLCNVSAKIVTKVLANRLKIILPRIISENQSAFVPGRLISDNILAAHELIHFINTRGRQRIGYCAMKLDMAKAYDRVEWDFLEEMHKKMGFPEEWTELIMACVKSVSYTIRINEKISEEFRPERGLRQGDPLSPYLFLICAEWLAMKLRREQEEANLRGIKICRQAPEVSHLLFADDSVLFLRANLRNMANLKRILKVYEEISGQKVNVTKSEICFSRNVSTDLKKGICDELGMRQVSSFSKYLGLPVVFSNNKTDIFKFVVERMWQKVQGWKEQTLSMAGKETLIKSVLQAIPSFAMMCFKIPVSICKRLAGIVCKYWWNNKGGDKCIYWGSYKLLCKPKEVGGLGWRDFETFNEAMLAKQVWRLHSCQDSLVSRLLRAKYFNDSDVLHSQLGHRPSFAWRSIWNARNKVSQWFSLEGSPQKLVWAKQDSGESSVRSAYVSLRRESELRASSVKGEQASQERLQSFWRRVWRLKVQPKVKIFAWRMYHNFLPSADNLVRRHCSVNTECQTCGWKKETTMHTLVQCWWARAFWESSRINCSFLDVEFSDPGDWLWFCAATFADPELAMILQGARHIWFHRNMVVNGQEGLNPFTEAASVRDSVLWSQKPERSLVVTSLVGDGSWQPPENGFIKINVDGAWDRDSGKAGIGLCGRDSDGVILFVAAEPFLRLTSCVEAELLSLRRSFELAEGMGYKKVIFELDNAGVFLAIQRRSRVEGCVAGHVTECRHRLGRNQNWFLSLIPREANEAADKLAKKAKREDWRWRNPEAIPIGVL
ncbi:unnamed protein product [Rhodiola kirilowii]